MRPALEDVTAFAADDLAGEAVAVQVFAAALDDAFFLAVLAKHFTGCCEDLTAHDCLVMVGQSILIFLAVVHMPVEL